MLQYTLTLFINYHTTETFRDTVLDLLSSVENIEMTEMCGFVGYIVTEEFDTDDMTEDIKDFKESNILNIIKTAYLRKIIYEYIQQTICMLLFLSFLCDIISKTYKKMK